MDVNEYLSISNDGPSAAEELTIEELDPDEREFILGALETIQAMALRDPSSIPPSGSIIIQSTRHAPHHSRHHANHHSHHHAPQQIEMSLEVHTGVIPAAGGGGGGNQNTRTEAQIQAQEQALEQARVNTQAQVHAHESERMTHQMKRAYEIQKAVRPAEYLDENSPRAIQPEGFRTIKLFPHQLSGLYKMKELEGNCQKSYTENEKSYKLDTKIGVLADISGYGKTVSLLALILSNPTLPDSSAFKIAIKNASENYCLAEKEQIDLTHFINSTLIVVPSSIIKQWEETLEETTLQFITYKTGDIQKALLKPKPEIVKPKLVLKVNGSIIPPPESIQEYIIPQVVLCADSRFKQLVSNNKPIVWRRFIIDEPDSICITSMPKIQFQFLWLVSATYERMYTSISNRGFLKDLCTDFPTKIMSRIVVQNKQEFCEQSYAMPHPIERYYKCLTPVVIKSIEQDLDRETREMLNAGDIDGVILRLGGNIDTDRNILDLVTRKYNTTISDSKNKIVYYESLINMVHSDKERKIKKLQDEIKHCESRIEDIIKKVDDMKNDECCLCGDDMKSPALLPCCNNIFCGACVINWFNAHYQVGSGFHGPKNSTCPMCRAPANIKTVHFLSLDKKPEEKTDGETGKLEKTCDKKIEQELLSKVDTLMNILRDIFGNNPRASVLIFSSYDYSFYHIGKQLEKSGFRYTNFDKRGDVSKKVEMYENGEYQIILLNALSYGAGLNLQTTTDIILYHQLDYVDPRVGTATAADRSSEMNTKKLERQIIGRGLRIGRSKDIPLNIHKLKYDNEYV